jgi:hypothetical protein
MGLRRRRALARRNSTVSHAYSIERLEPRRLLATISSGERLLESIAVVGEQDTHTFAASAHDSVSIVVGVLAGASFFPRIQVFGPNGVPLNIVATDWAFDLANLPLTGTYSVVVRDDNNLQTGSYALSMIKVAGAQIVDTDSGAIASNERRTGTIDLGDQDVYTFTANAGESISAVVGFDFGANFFPRIQVFAPNGSPLNTAGTDYQFDAQNLAQSGTYYLTVRDENNLQAGGYSLSIIRVPASHTIDADSGPIASNERRTGTIDTGDLDVYTFAASAGDAVSAVVGFLGGANFFPRIQVFAPNGLALNPITDYAFDAVNLAQGGTYTVVVRDDNNLQTGTYSLTLMRTPAAQTPEADSGTIASNQRRTGTIELGDLDVYTFSANAGDSLSALVGFVSGSNFFPRIQIFAPNGAPLNTTAEYFFDTPNLALTGIYYMVVRDDNNAQAGDYAVSIIRTPTAQTVDGDSGDIGSNQRRTGTIESGDLDVYTFAANAGDSVSAVVGFLSGANFFPRIQVFAPNGVPLNAAGVNYDFDAANLPLTGTYSIVVRDENNAQAGNYALSMIRTPATQVVDLDSGPIASNARRVGVIESGDLDVYTFSASAGDSVSAVVGILGGPNFFPRIQLFAPNGAALNALNYFVDAFNLPQGGTYSIVVRDDNNAQAGEYALTMIKVTGAQSLDADSGAIASNQRRVGAIQSGDLDVFTFDAQVGDTVAVVVGAIAGPNFGATLQVFAPNGVPLNDPGLSVSYDAQNLPQSGTYYVVVRDSNNAEDGDYAISLARSPGAQVADTLDNDGGAIASGQVRSGAINAGDLDVYTISLSAGAAATIRMGFLTGVNFAPQLDLVAPNGVLLATNVGFPALITLAAAPLDGTYYIVARDSDDFGYGNYSIAVDAAVGADTRAPQVTASRFDFNTARQQIVFNLSESVSGSVVAGDLTLQNLTTAAPIPAANIVASFNPFSNEVVFQFQNYPFLAVPNGDYQATLNAGSVQDGAGNPLAAGSSFNFFFINGDANRDRQVNSDDFNILATNFGHLGKNFSQGNFNYDAGGAVTSDDFNILATNFGLSVAAQSVNRGGFLRGRPLDSVFSSAGRISDEVMQLLE